MTENNREATSTPDEGIPDEAVGRDRQPVVEGGGANAEPQGHFVNSGPTADDAGDISDSQEKHSRAAGADDDDNDW
jgi:hypothetical protein